MSSSAQRSEAPLGSLAAAKIAGASLDWADEDICPYVDRGAPSLTGGSPGHTLPRRIWRHLCGGGLIYIILVGLIAGWATGKIMKGAGYGVIIDILLGIAGAIFGSWVLRVLGIYTSGGLIPSILVAILGAVLLVVIVRALKRA